AFRRAALGPPAAGPASRDPHLPPGPRRASCRRQRRARVLKVLGRARHSVAGDGRKQTRSALLRRPFALDAPGRTAPPAQRAAAGTLLTSLRSPRASAAIPPSSLPSSR